MKWLIKIVIICAILMILSAYVVSAAKSGKYKYTTSGGKATITEVDTSISGEVVIPSTLGGCPVTAIADDAFFLCSSITSLTIPDTVVSVGNSAFYSCSALEKIEISSSVKTIKESAFSECSKLKEINIANENTEISFIDGILYCGTTAIFCSNVYCTENNIKEVYIKEGISRIGDYAFAKCDGITKAVFPKSTTSIGNNAFEVCKNLKEAIIHGNVTSIGEYAFMENFALESVTYNGAKEPVFGDGVFENCLVLKSISVPYNYLGDTFGGYLVNKANVDAKLSISQDGETITVENVSEVCKLIVASYMDENLVDCKIIEISEGGEYKLSDMKGLIYDKMNADVIRVFMWKDMIDFNPVCVSEEYCY